MRVFTEVYGKLIWIPHRLLFKKEFHATTKIRPVFNCLLKIEGKYSLNEGAYTGVNLINNMIEILQRFKTNKYVMLGDIRKALRRKTRIGSASL